MSNAETLEVTEDGLTFEGRRRTTPGGNDIIHITGPTEHKKPQRGLFNLTTCEWVKSPDIASTSVRSRRFFQAAAQIIKEMAP